MEDWKQTVAANLAELRKSQHLTQAQLAEKLHYSDKAISKWERGESLPDLGVMKQIADYYGISIDSLMRMPGESPAPAEDSEQEPKQTPEPAQDSIRRNRLLIAGMAALLVWLIASMIFVVLDTAVPELEYGPFLFLYALPVTAVVCLVFNSIWFNPRRNFAIISVLLWSVIGALFLTLYKYRIWKLFLIGIPAQLIIILWSRLKPVGKTERRNENPEQ
ncbi:MAG: helix-turn-helix domain-containing protein [Oscillospiraceae bacterium]|nr:helix-turn-helix domain-containing protein [Oscillospiraceae bacterium]